MRSQRVSCTTSQIVSGKFGDRRAIECDFRNRILALQRLAARLEIDVLGETAQLDHAPLCRAHARNLRLDAHLRLVCERKIQEGAEHDRGHSEDREDAQILTGTPQAIHGEPAAPQDGPDAQLMEQCFEHGLRRLAVAARTQSVPSRRGSRGHRGVSNEV